MLQLSSKLLEKLDLPKSTTIYAKLDNLSIGGSKKDRIARQIVLQALADGSLKKGQIIVELTSGNTGTGLAIASACLGHEFIAVMSSGNSQERAMMMRALGATVVIVEQHITSKKGQVSGKDLDLVEDEARRIVSEKNAFRADQFNLPASFEAHYQFTGPEIYIQCSGVVDGFVDFVGSGGTFVGTSKYFKEVSHGSIQCFVVEPDNFAVLKNEAERNENCCSTSVGGHRLQGGGYEKSFDSLRMFDPAVCGVERKELIDGYLTVTDEESMNCSRLLARTDGVFGGFSAGANLAAAVKIIKDGRASKVAIMVCDNGLKYLSTDLYAEYE